MKYVLVNPLSNNRHGKEAVEKVLELVKDEKEVIDITEIDLKEFVTKLKKTDEIILVGGDGTINNFVNKLEGKNSDLVSDRKAIINKKLEDLNSLLNE